MERLTPEKHDFNVSRMLVVDLMHEFEIGVWKTLFTHAVRVLYAASKPSGVLVDTLNERYLHSVFPLRCDSLEIDLDKCQHLVWTQYDGFKIIYRK